jgi:hypothetical protein
MNKDTLITADNDEVINPVSLTDKEGRLALRSKIDQYAEALQKEVGSDRGNMDEVNQEGLTEYFVDGAYIRELIIPKGQTIVSELWNRDRLWVITYGDVTITTELGRQRITGPYIGMAPFGSRVALYTHEETQWLAITGAKATNSEDILKEVKVNDYSDLSYPWDKLESKAGEKI